MNNLSSTSCTTCPPSSAEPLDAGICQHYRRDAANPSSWGKPLCAYVQAGLVICGGRVTILRCPNSVLMLVARTPLTRR
jgi:hypothetical protein